MSEALEAIRKDDLILKGAAALIGMALTAGVIALSLLGSEIPETISMSLAAVIGYFFGAAKNGR